MRYYEHTYVFAAYADSHDKQLDKILPFIMVLSPFTMQFFNISVQFILDGVAFAYGPLLYVK